MRGDPNPGFQNGLRQASAGRLASTRFALFRAGFDADHEEGALKKKRTARSTRPKHRAKRARSSPWTIGTQAIIVGVICVLAAVPLITARQSPPPPDATDLDLPSEPDVEPEQLLIPARRATAKPVRPEAASVPTTAPAIEPTSTAFALIESPVAAPASTAKTDVPDAASTTITGCLELDEQTFRLKDTSGVDAPKSRSWRSGFMRKRSVSIVLLDATGTLNLPEHVGHRVTATGSLTDRELRARSLTRVATTCN